MKNNDSPFGGIQLVLSGDFLQLPPVSKYGQPKKKFTFQVIINKKSQVKFWKKISGINI